MATMPRETRGAFGLPTRSSSRPRSAEAAVSDPAWVRPGMLLTLALTTLLYTWGLDRSGYANQYYSAAVQAASKSWKAFFYGSIDAGNFITVDKPPLALWLMDLSARVFGVNSWAILLPEALAGVAGVYLLFRVVRRVFGPVPALVAAVVMATTPVAVVMFRYNNPDALLTLLLLASGWALLRALDSGRTRWLVLSATFIGLGFNTKFLQAYVLLPALLAVFVVAGQGGAWHRLRQLGFAALALVVSSGWWVAVVALVPAASRPYIGGSTNNSVLNLVFGYDGLGRIFGQGGRAIGAAGRATTAALQRGPGGAGGFGGTPGILRVFNAELGGQVSWLLPAALVAVGVGLWARRGAPRTDLVRAGYLLFGGWLVVHTLVFDFAGGILHSYYTVAMAPAIGALVGAGAVELWKLRRAVVARMVMAATVAGSTWWATQLLGRTPSFTPGLGVAITVAGCLGAGGLLLPAGNRPLRLTGMAAAGLAALALMGGPVAYSISSAQQSYSGGDPAAGPAVARAGGPGGLAGRGQFAPPTGVGAGAGTPPGGAFRQPVGAFGPPPGGFPGAGGPAAGIGVGAAGRPAFGIGVGAAGGPASGIGVGAAAAGIGGTGGGGPAGGATDTALVRYLAQNRGTATWIVAVASANQSAGIQLASGLPVMAMGGFSGSDPAMTVTQLQALVASGRLRYVVVGGGGPGGPGGPGGGNSAVSTWVQAHGSLVDYGGTGGSSLYDLSGASR